MITNVFSIFIITHSLNIRQVAIWIRTFAIILITFITTEPTFPTITNFTIITNRWFSVFVTHSYHTCFSIFINSLYAFMHLLQRCVAIYFFVQVSLCTSFCLMSKNALLTIGIICAIQSTNSSLSP